MVHEFDEVEKNGTRKKIKGRLRYYKLGEYKQEREDYIRALKNALYAELKKLVSLGTSGRPARRWFQRRTGCTAVLSVPPQDGGGSTQ